jgi:hypothetical protein
VQYSAAIGKQVRCWREAADSDPIEKSVLSYIELQKFLLHREQKRVIFATLVVFALIKALKTECLKGEAALFGEVRF